MKFGIKKLMLFIWIIAVIGAGIIFVLWYKNYNTKNINTFKFKKFTYEVPENVTFKTISEDQFEIISGDMDVTVEIFVDKQRDIHSQDLMRSALLKENGIYVWKAQKEKIEDTDILCYEKMNVKELLCYFDTFDSFAYEILSKKNTNINDLKQIVHILLKAKYDYNSTEKYSYYGTYEKLTENLK